MRDLILKNKLIYNIINCIYLFTFLSNVIYKLKLYIRFDLRNKCQFKTFTLRARIKTPRRKTKGNEARTRGCRKSVEVILRDK